MIQSGAEIDSLIHVPTKKAEPSIEEKVEDEEIPQNNDDQEEQESSSEKSKTSESDSENSDMEEEEEDHEQVNQIGFGGTFFGRSGNSFSRQFPRKKAPAYGFGTAFANNYQTEIEELESGKCISVFAAAIKYG